MSDESKHRYDPVVESSDSTINAILESSRSTSGLGVIPNFHGALANHPEVLRRIVECGLGRMVDGELTVRQREIIVLRTARLCAARYEWAHHRRRAAERGLSPADVRLAWHGADTAHNETDTALLRTCDALHHRSDLDDELWILLSEALGESAAIEAVTVIGWFHMIAFLGNSLRLAVEAGVDATFGPEAEHN